MFQEQHLAFSTIFSILAPNKTLFAFASRYGNSSEYNKQMCQVFTEKCASYAKLHPDFEFQVDNISVKDKVQVEKILKEINSYDNLVITSPIHAGFSYFVLIFQVCTTSYIFFCQQENLKVQ